MSDEKPLMEHEEQTKYMLNLISDIREVRIDLDQHTIGAAPSADAIKTFEKLLADLQSNWDLWERDVFIDEITEMYVSQGTIIGSPSPMNNALYALYHLLNAQRRAGSNGLVEGLHQTVLYGEKLYPLLSAECIRRRKHKTFKAVHKTVMRNWNQEAAHLHAQVGMRKEAVQNVHRFIDEAPHDSDFLLLKCRKMNDDEIWSFLRKIDSRYDIPIACIYCGAFQRATEKHNQCSRCSNALYCSKECQKKHWKIHKLECKKGPPGK